MISKNALMLLAAAVSMTACSSKPTNPTAMNPTGNRAVASVHEIGEETARINLANGTPFSISCSKTADGKRPVSLEFTAPGLTDGTFRTDTFTSNYSQVALLLKSTNDFRKANTEANNLILVSGNSKYWKTPNSLGVVRSNLTEPAFIHDARYTLYSTCSELRSYMDENGYYGSSNFNVLSIVGPYISTQINASYYTGGAHGSAYTGFDSIDSNKIEQNPKNSNTSHANSKFSLFDIASEASITAALKSDKFLLKKIGSKLTAAKNTDEIHQLMFKKMNDCEINIPQDKKEAFNQIAIFDYNSQKNEMAVRVGFSYGCEAARGNFVQLGLLMQPNPQFMSLLNNEIASANEQGRKPFFMRYAQQLK
jgi:hypothetical protein